MPWLRTLFGALGVEDMQFILADGTREIHMGRIDRATFLAPHIKAVQKLFAPEEVPVEA
jgi:FMN-dependent NADH-azoreductase